MVCRSLLDKVLEEWIDSVDLRERARKMDWLLLGRELSGETAEGKCKT